MPRSRHLLLAPSFPDDGAGCTGRRRGRPIMAAVRLPLVVLAALLVAACSGERPYLLDATTTTAPTTTAVAAPAADVQPVRSDCQAVSGPGPLQVVIESTASTNPCVALASYQQVEFVNNAAEPVSFTLGAAPIALQPAESTISQPIGTLLGPGYTAVATAVQPIVGLWVVDTQEDTLFDERMGLRGLGPIEIGNTIAEVSDSLGVVLPNSDAACFVTSIEQDPYSPLLTIQDGAVSMIEVYSTNQFTRSEIGIGTAEDDVRAVYGARLEEQPSPDGDANRKLLVFVPADEADQIYRLVFELENGAVVGMRNGLSAVALAGVGCS